MPSTVMLYCGQRISSLQEIFIKFLYIKELFGNGLFICSLLNVSGEQHDCLFNNIFSKVFGSNSFLLVFTLK